MTTTKTSSTWTQDSPSKNTWTDMKVLVPGAVRIQQTFGTGDVTPSAVVLDEQMVKAAARLLGLKVVA